MSEVSGIDDYVAWLTFRKKDGTHSDGRIRICDSDSPGAFKVYRAAPISAARVIGLFGQPLAATNASISESGIIDHVSTVG